jgi:hypothetical protein
MTIAMLLKNTLPVRRDEKINKINCLKSALNYI